MKKILILSILAMTFMACGGEENTNGATVEEKKFSSCKDIYTEEYIRSKFSDIQEIKSSFDRGCGYVIIGKNETYNTFYIVNQGANENMLTQSVSYFSGVKPFPDLGENAYIYSVGGIKQVTLLENSNLISSYVWLSSNFKFDKEKTIELVLDMNEKLK